ncbi:MAG: NADH-quinone oxidoreductase subunit N [Saprospiraceae bacterium]|nr:NADH-quinone oxidoreductase subunit N [Saprospiraceae bacterium]
MTALLILFFTALIVLFAGLSKKRSALQPIALVGSLLALGGVFAGPPPGWNDMYPNMFVFDNFALAFSAVAILSAALIFGLSGWGFRNLNATLGDNYGLILFSLCGALCMFSFTNLVMLFLGIEILSIPLYVLAGSRRDDLRSNEAALKYFLMGAFATGILLFGIALVYGSTGSFDLATINRVLSAGSASPMLLNVGILMIVIGLSFKVSAVPFHFWAPDVYTGSPNLITAFMATVVKTAGFAAFFRLFSVAFAPAIAVWSLPVAVVAGLTMTLANTTALFQTDFKRMMAYSSISHAGYLLLAILAIGEPGADRALLFYLLSYALATICAFGAFIVVSEPKNDGSFAAFNGLAKNNSFLAAVLAISMLSLAGIPPLAGFFGKYFIFSAAFAKYPWLVVVAVINSAISIYYYFKVIIAAYFTKNESSDEEVVHAPGSIRLTVALGLLLTIVLAVMPYLAFAFF